MKKYELLVIYNGSAKEETHKKEVEKLTAFLEKEKAEKISVDIWGLKKYAYPINYKTEGYYVLVNFESAAETPNKLAAVLKVNETVVRYMFVNKS